MRQLVTIFVFTALLLQCLARVSVVGLFELRRDFVASKLCENRGRPELKCCGSCVLEKQLRKSDDGDSGSKHSPPKSGKGETLACILPSAAMCVVSAQSMDESRRNPRQPSHFDRLRLMVFFHPPPLLA